MLSDSTFHAAADRCSYLDLFTKSRYAIYGGNREDGVEHEAEYLKMREAFKLGVFNNYEVSVKLFDNDCYFSEVDWVCCHEEASDYYCATDGNGDPTATSDVRNSPCPPGNNCD